MAPLQRPLLFLDVDGPLIPFGATRYELPGGYPTYAAGPDRLAGANPLLERIDPGLGPKLAALPCDLVWASGWMAEANECVAPLLGLPDLPVVMWPELPASPEPPDVAEPLETDEPGRLHWKTRCLVDWAAGRAFAWVDDEITGADRAWVNAHHRGRSLLHRVDPAVGLTEPDFAALAQWLSAGRPPSRPQEEEPYPYA